MPSEPSQGVLELDVRAAEKLNLPNQKSNRSMFSLLKSTGGPSTISDPLMLIAPSLPASIARVPAGSFRSAASAPAYTVRYPRSRVFHRTTVCTTPACTYGLLMFGSDNPITRTSDRPAWRTASAAPGTAGAEIAIISFTDG